MSCRTFCFVAVVAILLVLFTSLSGLIGLWSSSSEGRKVLHTHWLHDRNYLVKTPKHQRSLVWRLHSLYSTLVYDLPGFIVGFHGDRAKMYGSTAELTDGAPAGFKDSVMVFDFAKVSETLNNPHQPRGIYLGNAPVPEACMGADTLIFQGTGKTHSAMRDIFSRIIPSFSSSFTIEGLELDYGEDGEPTALQLATMSTAQADDLLRRTLVRTLFRGVFGAPASPAGLQALLDYPSYGGTCVLGKDFHAATGGVILSKLLSLRAAIRLAIAPTPVGIALKAAAAKAVAEGVLPGDTEEERSGDALVRQLADGVAFAGTLGTTHLTTHALARIRSDPAHYVPLYFLDPAAFLHEEARVDPPVTSVTSVFSENVTLSIGPNSHRIDVSLAAGTPYQNVISTANVDPIIFGGAFHSKRVAHQFDPSRANMHEMLSWNGRLGDVQKGKAPRGCPGYRLSMAIAQSLVSKFSPSATQIPQALDPESTAAAASLENVAPIKQGAKGDGPPSSFFFLDAAGFSFWLACCVCAIGYLLGRGTGSCSARYIQYLFAQVLVSLGFIWSYDWLYLQGMAMAAVAYALIFLTTTFQPPVAAAGGDNKMPAQGRATGGIFYSSLVWLMYGFFVAAISFVGFFGGKSGYASMMGPVMAWYGACASLGVVSLVRYWWRCSSEAKALEAEADKERIKAVNARLYIAKLGVVGGFFGVVDLLFVYVPTFGHVLSRLFDSLLYVPLILLALVEMDKAYPSAEVVLPNSAFIRSAARVSSVLAVILAVGLGYIWMKVSSGDICAFQTPYPAPSAPHYSLCKGSPFSRVDAYGRVMFTVATALIEGASEPAQRAANEDPRAVLLPKYEKRIPRIEVIPGTGFTIPGEDEDTEDVQGSWLFNTVKDVLLGTVLRSPLLFPIHDSPEVWGSLEEARLALEIAGGKHLPSPVSNWEGVDVTSDAAISQMCFAGLAGSLVERVSASDRDGSIFKVDLHFMLSFDVRPGYEQFGAVAFFDKEAKLLRIFWSHAGRDVYPGDRDWAHAKWAFRCSALVGITAIEHLLENHLVYANIASTAARESAPKDHPMRRFLKPFNHLTPTINMGAYLLLTTEHSLLHRTVSLTYNGLLEAFHYALERVRYQANPLDKHRKDLEILGDRFPYARDGLDFYELLRFFVSSYTRTYYPTDSALHADAALANFWAKVRVFGSSSGLPPFSALTLSGIEDVLTGYIFHVTGFHHVVGNVAEYLLLPNFAAARIRPRLEVSDVEASLYGLLVAVLTGAKAPMLMSDFEHLLLRDEHHETTTKIFRAFQANLTAFAGEIDERNARRKAEGRWVYHGFDPRRMLSSVSI